MNNLSINIYTDGACSGNPGPGGWAALVLMSGKYTKEKVVVRGGMKHTTNNRMELMAVVESLRLLQKLNIENARIKVISDSAYIVKSINNGDLKKWTYNGWKTTRKKDVSNKDLWEKAVKLINSLNPVFVKVKGHSGNKFNDYVDKIAVEECAKYKQME